MKVNFNPNYTAVSTYQKTNAQKNVSFRGNNDNDSWKDFNETLKTFQQMDNSEAKIKGLNAKNQALEAKNKELEKRNKELETKNAALKAKYDEAKATNTQLRKLLKERIGHYESKASGS